MSLELLSLPHPAEPGRTLKAFRDWEAVFSHLRDHVLAEPECAGWALLLGSTAWREVLGDGKARMRAVSRGHGSRGDELQDLYDQYVAICGDNATDARKLGWAVRGRALIAIGLDGVLLVVDDDREVLLSAMLPGQGDPEATRRGRSGLAAPHRPQRESSRSWLDRHRARDVRAQRYPRRSWSPEQRLYYTVFKPAIQFVRSQAQQPSIGGETMMRVSEAGLLRRVLPRFAALRFDPWLALRSDTRAGEEA